LANMKDEPTAFEMLMDFTADSVTEFESSVYDEV